MSKELEKKLTKLWVDEESPYIHHDKVKALIKREVTKGKIEELKKQLVVSNSLLKALQLLWTPFTSQLKDRLKDLRTQLTKTKRTR